MKAYIAAIALAAPLLVTGCASNTGKEIEVRDQAEAPTGSNLPRRDKSDVKVIKGDDARDAMSRGSAPTPKSGGSKSL